MSESLKYPVYGVEQSNHGHLYRWVFTEENLLQELSKAGYGFDGIRTAVIINVHIFKIGESFTVSAGFGKIYSAKIFISASIFRF